MKKLIAILALLLVSNTYVFASFGATTAFNVVAGTGVDTNGGAFYAGVASPGTDESLSAGTAITITTASSTTGTGSPAFTSTTHGPGNFVHIASGTGCVVGWHGISTQSAGTATFESAIADTNGRTCVGTIGGPLLTFAAANAIAVAGNTVWCSGTQTLTTTQTVSVGMFVNGFSSTHGDAGVTTPCTFTTATDSTTLFFTSGISLSLSNVALSTTASVKANAIEARTNHNGEVFLNHDKISGGFVNCVDGDNIGSTFSYLNIIVRSSELTGCTGETVYDNRGGTMIVAVDNNFHGNTSTYTIGAINGNYLLVDHNLFNGNTGIDVNTGVGTGIPSFIQGNTFYNSGVTAISLGASQATVTQNNIIYGAVTGISFSPSGDGLHSIVDSNAFGNNTANGYTGTNPITLSAIPFTTAGSGDFSLNSTAGGGTACKGAGVPGAFPQGLTTGHPDVGAAQSSSSGSSGASGSMCVQ